MNRTRPGSYTGQLTVRSLELCVIRFKGGRYIPSLCGVNIVMANLRTDGVVTER